MSLVHGDGRAAEQARLDAALTAQVVLAQKQALAAIAQLPYAPTGVPQGAIQWEVQQRYTELGLGG